MFPADTVMGSLEPTMVKWVLMTEESLLEWNNNELLRRVVLERLLPPSDGLLIRNMTNGEEQLVPTHL